MLLSEGQMSDYKGEALMIDAFPKAKALLGNKGYDADWFRQALTNAGSCMDALQDARVEMDVGARSSAVTYA
jgi:hypothetical protein